MGATSGWDRVAREARRRTHVALRRRPVQGRARAAASLLAASLATAGPALAADEGLSAWSRSPHVAVRLVGLGPSPTGGADRAGAIEIRLDPGYRTYWRSPGEAGLPPTLDASASTNVAAVAMDFPAPSVFEEAGTRLFGYAGTVTFPLRIRVADPARPATLSVTLDYGVCATLCLPGRATLSLPLPGADDPEARALVEAARAAVPAPAALGAPGTPAIERVDRAAAGQGGLEVVAHAGPGATLFAEGPDGWFLLVGDPRSEADGRLVFPVTVPERPSGSADRIDLRLTLVDGTRAIEVPARVDVGAATP